MQQLAQDAPSESRIGPVVQVAATFALVSLLAPFVTVCALAGRAWDVLVAAELGSLHV